MFDNLFPDRNVANKHYIFYNAARFKNKRVEQQRELLNNT